MAESKVRLIHADTWGLESGDLAVVNKARVSYDRWKEKLDHNDYNLIRFLAWHGHGTPFEAVTFTYHIEMPIFVARQLVKYRLTSWNEMSRRYVDKPLEFFDGYELRFESESKKKLHDESAKKIIRGFNKSAEISYNTLRRMGVVKEQARMVQPVHTMTTVVWQMNLRELAHIASQRLAPDAQRETREVVEKMVELAMPYAPNSLRALLDFNEILNAVRSNKTYKEFFYRGDMSSLRYLIGIGGNEE